MIQASKLHVSEGERIVASQRNDHVAALLMRLRRKLIEVGEERRHVDHIATQGVGGGASSGRWNSIPNKRTLQFALFLSHPSDPVLTACLAQLRVC